jgi:hypothetical protein
MAIPKEGSKNKRLRRFSVAQADMPVLRFIAKALWYAKLPVLCKAKCLREEIPCPI